MTAADKTNWSATSVTLALCLSFYLQTNRAWTSTMSMDLGNRAWRIVDCCRRLAPSVTGRSWGKFDSRNVTVWDQWVEGWDGAVLNIVILTRSFFLLNPTSRVRVLTTTQWRPTHMLICWFLELDVRLSVQLQWIRLEKILLKQWPLLKRKFKAPVEQGAWR